MGADSKIEWCDHTFNPWIGCTKVSAGCAHCYAEARDKRLGGGKHWGFGAPRQRTSPANWRLPLKWSAVRDGGGVPRPRVFCASLADWLDNEVPIQWLCDLMTLIWSTPRLDWLLLTKRPENWERRLEDVFVAGLGTDRMLARQWLGGDVPSNIWVGVSVENQRAADERTEGLARIPSRVRFLSCEPLIGPVLQLQSYAVEPFIDWVICGGESGPGARPMREAWAQNLRWLCGAQHIPFFMKQGSGNGDHEGWPAPKDFSSFPVALQRREFPVAV